MTAALGGWAIPRRVLALAAIATAVMLVPLVGAWAFAGIPAALGVVMGYIAGARPALTLPPAQALALAVPAAMAGAVAVALRGQPVPAACFVALCCLLAAPASMITDGLMAGVPSAAAVLVSVPGDYQPVPVALWMLLGGAVAAVLASRLVPRGPRPAGVPMVRAWRHAVVMALAVGIVVYVVDVLNWPHGYWVALTLTLVLRPFDDQTLERSWQRVAGTIAGVLLALVLAAVLPLWGVALALGVCQLLSLAYATRGDYARQVVFLTPTVVLLGSAADERAAERALYTLAGAVLAGALAASLSWYDTRREREAAA